jgi:DNA-binding IclR family transcriptional regulator
VAEDLDKPESLTCAASSETSGVSFAEVCSETAFRAERISEVAMSYTYEELKTKTIAELREIAKDVQHDAVQGYSQMNKDHLLPSLCRALGVDMRGHHEVVGIDKAGIKAKIRELKRQRDELLQAGDRSQLKTVRRHMHHLNHQLRAHMR